MKVYWVTKEQINPACIPGGSKVRGLVASKCLMHALLDWRFVQVKPLSCFSLYFHHVINYIWLSTEHQSKSKVVGDFRSTGLLYSYIGQLQDIGPWNSSLDTSDTEKQDRLEVKKAWCSAEGVNLASGAPIFCGQWELWRRLMSYGTFLHVVTDLLFQSKHLTLCHRPPPRQLIGPVKNSRQPVGFWKWTKKDPELSALLRKLWSSEVICAIMQDSWGFKV